MMKRWTPFLIIAFSLPAEAFSASLRDAIDHALKFSPKMATKHYALETAQLTHDNSRASYLPQLAASSLVGMAGQRFVATNSSDELIGPTSKVDVRLSETIWDGGLRGFEVERSEIAIDIAQLNYLDARNQLILEITKAYFDFSEAADLHTAQKASLEISKKQFAQAEAFYKAGVTPRRDFLRSQAEVQRLQLNAAQSNDNAIRLSDVLRSLTGASVQDAPELAYVPMMPVATIVAAVLGKAPSSPSTSQDLIAVKRDRLQRAAADISLAMERRKTLWPTVDLSVGSSYGASDFVGAKPPRKAFFEQDAVTWNVQLAVHYTLWDWGTARRNVEILANQQSLEKSERADVISHLLLQRASSLKAREFSAKNYELSQELLRLDEDAFKTIENDYRQGRASYVDVGDALEKLLESQTSASRTYFSHLRTTWESFFYEGVIYEKAMAL